MLRYENKSSSGIFNGRALFVISSVNVAFGVDKMNLILDPVDGLLRYFFVRSFLSEVFVRVFCSACPCCFAMVSPPF
jgi:hypothetical protein